MTRLSLSGLLLAFGLLVLTFQPVRAENPDQVKQLRETGKCTGCDLSGADLAGLTVNLADLRGANLTGAQLYKARLRMANLAGANLSATNLVGADLFGARGANLAAAITDDKTTCPDGHAGPCR